MSKLYLAGIVAMLGGLTILGIIAIDQSYHTVKYMSLNKAIEDDLSNVAINKVMMQARTLPQFLAFTSGPPLCISRMDYTHLASNPALLDILLDADKNGESARHRLTADEFISMARMLCISKDWVKENEGRSIQWYPGLIATENGKYWYSPEIFWNKTEASSFKMIDENFDGRMPRHERLKVFMFAGNYSYFEEPNELLHGLQKIVYFELANDEPFGASRAGIYNNDNYLVIPNAVEFYIDPEIRKPDGSAATIDNLHPDSTFGNGMSIGGFGILYDYEYVDTPAIWFVVDGKKYAERIDANIEEIKDLIADHISTCLAFKQLHPDTADGPCPPNLTYSHTETLTVEVDKAVYARGEDVLITRTVPEVLERGQIVAIQVFNPENTMYTITQVEPNTDRTYAIDLKITGKLAIAGTYTVKVTYLGESIQTTFDVRE